MVLLDGVMLGLACLEELKVDLDGFGLTDLSWVRCG